MLDSYEKEAYEEVLLWIRKLKKPSTLTQSFTKNVQTKLNHYMPKKVHQAMGAAVKNMTESVINGSEYFPDKKYEKAPSLREADKQLEDLLSVFKKGAAAEGAGTGAGGIFLGAVDFPLLLAFKMRFLFSGAALYGLDVSDFRDRLYLLHIFQAAFSSSTKRRETAELLESWDEYVSDKPRKLSLAKEVDWVVFQQEYRDHIDLVKMLQLMPGFGAVVGAAANYHLLGQLGEAAKQGYRLKWLSETYDLNR
ncbi:EcsC protein family protein [Alteribacillus iranensis]|uniref:EcsC protein family protein n=1 Tax=Alteribacillus iranensis TaxID=930128 RepID=A0A1I1Z8M6_9BACI|nr:EcsC protein family protein [Alteribacillus iranensis]